MGVNARLMEPVIVAAARVRRFDGAVGYAGGSVQQLRGGARAPAARDRRGAAVRVRGAAEAEATHDLH